MAKVNSVVDTMLGEAAHGTRQQRYTDMLGIASVIANRAAVTRTTPQQVVSVPSQFNAFGKSLPAGAKAYRSLAEKAWNEVQQKGPVHNATFYATPSASKNLPKGLQQVAATSGHVYYSDPKNRAIKTAVGYVTPVANAVSRLSDAAIKAVDSVTAPVRNVAANVANMGAAMRTAAFSPVSRPSVDIPSVPQNYDLPSRAMSPVSYNMGPKRPSPPSQALVGKLQQAVTDTLGPGFGVNVVSGQGQFGSSRHRDPAGIAADVQVVDLSTNRPVTNPQKMMDVAQAFAAQGGMGVGYGPEYMGLGTMHLDTAVPGPGQDNEWGSIGNANASLLADARNSALMPQSFYDRNLPSVMSAPPSRQLEAFAAAPIGKVDRAPLGPVSTPALPSRPASLTPRAAIAASQNRPASDVIGGMLTGMNRPAAMPSRPVSQTPRAALAQSVNQPTNAINTMLTGMEQRPAMPARPVSQTPPAALAAMTAPQLTASIQSFVQQPPQPTFVPAQVPNIPAVPVTMPTVARIKTPNQRIDEAFQASAPPRASAMDVYNGKATQGYANDGSMVSRDQFGNTSITNKFGATTTTNARGQQMGRLGLGPAAPSVPSSPSAISGPLGSPGIPSPSKGFMGISPPTTETARIGRNVAGSFAGGAIGSLLGPIGSLVGAAIGQSIARGQNPLDAITGNRGRVSFNTPTFGIINAVAPQTGGGFGAFPNAPNRPGLGGTQSNRSSEGMRSISPAAASSISKGKGGLF